MVSGHRSPSPGRERPPADDGGLRRKAPAEDRREAERRPGRRFWRWLLNGAQPQPVPSCFGTVEQPERGKAGICCSGGGIRSAAFSLGALQALGKRGELRRAAYLAAVSGGSYIAAAASMVAKTEVEDGGEEREKSEDSDPDLLRQMGPFAPGSPEEQYLRNRSSYLAPTLGDKIYLGLRVVLGLLLNLVFVAAPLAGFALVLAGVLYAPLLPDLAGSCGKDCAASPPPWFFLVPLATLAASLLFGFVTLLVKWRSDGRERFFAVWATRLLVLAGLLGLVLLGLPYLVQLIDGLAAKDLGVKAAENSTGEPPTGVTAPAFGGGFLALVVAVAAQLAHLLSSKQAVEEMSRARKTFSKLGGGLRLAIAYAAAAVVGPLLLLGAVGLVLAQALAEATPHAGVEMGLVVAGAATLAAFAVVYCLVDLTTWSLHPFYRRRLSSAFALKRVRADALTAEERRRVEALAVPEPGTAAGIALERDYDELLPLSMTACSETRDEDRRWPTLLVCAAANVSDPGATPPGRYVTSFTFSSQTVGGPLVGAVRTWELEHAFESREEVFPDPGESASKPRGARRRRRADLTLPAAVAMSGAAISPSMGKMTHRPLTFLMALANVRLGVWVANPRRVGQLEASWVRRRLFARPRPWYLLCELIGRNRIGGRYLYVTDGGHYENLGLVELLRRGCTEVYCFDASGVGEGRAEFEALGEAIAIARSELGVEIEFGDCDPGDLEPDEKTHLAKRDVVRGRISYPDGPSGTLVYVRNSMTEKAPWDARAHQRTDPRFPHNSTIDQLYTDQKFEAYRVLGARAGARAVAQMREG